MPGFNFREEATATNAEFAAEIARLTALSAEDVERLFPRLIDKERLTELMKIVRSSESRNERAAKLRSNIGNLAESAMKLLELFT